MCPKTGWSSGGAAHHQLQMLPTKPPRPALYIAARVDGSVARHEVAAHREVRGRRNARPSIGSLWGDEGGIVVGAIVALIALLLLQRRVRSGRRR